jgi:hypothetical protein
MVGCCWNLLWRKDASIYILHLGVLKELKFNVQTWEGPWGAIETWTSRIGRAWRKRQKCHSYVICHFYGLRFSLLLGFALKNDFLRFMNNHALLEVEIKVNKKKKGFHLFFEVLPILWSCPSFGFFLLFTTCETYLGGKKESTKCIVVIGKKSKKGMRCLIMFHPTNQYLFTILS